VFRPLEGYVGLPILTVGVLCFVVFLGCLFRCKTGGVQFAICKKNLRLDCVINMTLKRPNL
jgi:hypothetical protein